MLKPVFATATELTAAIRCRQISAVELLEAQLTHVTRHNPQLNALVTLDEQGARQQARKADAALQRGRSHGEKLGLLHGLPVTLKDCHPTAGLRTTAGTQDLADHVPAKDGWAAAALRAAGAIIIGKSNVPARLDDIQTSNELFGRTNNPWNPNFTAGGSSGGAAAALAAGLTPLDIGSDKGGSIRIPAHFCGLFGFKPTEQRVSIRGHIPEPPHSITGQPLLTAVGPMARSVEDLELAMRVLTAADRHNRTSLNRRWRDNIVAPSFKKLRIAWAATFPGVPVSNTVRRTVEKIVSELARLGAQVEECQPEISFAEQIELILQLNRLTVEDFGFGSRLTPEEAEAVMARRAAIIRVWDAFMAKYDAFICPAAMVNAFPHCAKNTPLDVDGEAVNYWHIASHCRPFNLSTQPAVVLPVTSVQNSMPVGIQLIGRRWCDEYLLAVARRVAEVTGKFVAPPAYTQVAIPTPQFSMSQPYLLASPA